MRGRGGIGVLGHTAEPFGSGPRGVDYAPGTEPKVRTPADHFIAQIAGRIPASAKFEDREDLAELQSRGIEDMPHIWMPHDGLPINKQFVIACPAVGTVGTVVGSYTLSQNWWSVIRRVSLFQTAPGYPEGSGDLTWRILVAGNPTADFGNLIVQMGQISGSAFPEEVSPVIVRPNSIVQVQVDNANWNPAGVNIIARLVGWQWPFRSRG